MTATALAILVCLPSTDAVRPSERVLVMHYGIGVMSRVIEVRRRQGYKVRTDVEGYAARPSCGTIGSVFWLSVGGRRVKLQQMDCAQPGDRARLLARRVVEVDYATGVRLGVVRTGARKGLMWPSR